MPLSDLTAKSLHMIHRFRLFVLVVFFTSFALADDFKTINGKEYKNAKLSRVEPDGIVITFSGGIVKLPFTELSPEIQKKYGYDPKAAGDFQKQVYEAGVTRAREIAESQAATNARCPPVSARNGRQRSVHRKSFSDALIAQGSAQR